MFIKEYINFKIFCYLRHCGFIPVQSFRSQIGKGGRDSNKKCRLKQYRCYII